MRGVKIVSQPGLLLQEVMVEAEHSMVSCHDFCRILDELFDTCTDAQAADRLNALGHKNWRGQAFTTSKVRTVRHAYKLKRQDQRLSINGWIRADDLAHKLGVSATTIRALDRARILRRHPCSSNARLLYEDLPDGVTLIPGKPGRHPIPARLSTVQMSSQEIS